MNTDEIGDLASISSQTGPSQSVGRLLKDNVAMLERISRNGGAKSMDGRLMTPICVSSLAVSSTIIPHSASHFMAFPVLLCGLLLYATFVNAWPDGCVNRALSANTVDPEEEVLSEPRPTGEWRLRIGHSWRPTRDCRGVWT